MFLLKSQKLPRTLCEDVLYADLTSKNSGKGLSSVLKPKFFSHVAQQFSECGPRTPGGPETPSPRGRTVSLITPRHYLPFLLSRSQSFPQAAGPTGLDWTILSEFFSFDFEDGNCQQT